jgi:hypothetical protein
MTEYMQGLFLGAFIGALAMLLVMLIVLLWSVVRSYQLGLREAKLPPDQRTIKVMFGKHDRSGVTLRGYFLLSPNLSETPQNDPNKPENN